MVETSPQTHSEWWPSVLDPLRQLGTRVADFFSPPSDAAATEDAYVIDIDLPGVEKDNINVELNGNMLTVRGHKHSTHEEKGKAYFYAERSYGAFQRSFKIPSDVDSSAIDATSKDGVLTLRLPRNTANKEMPHKLEIKSL